MRGWKLAAGALALAALLAAAGCSGNKRVVTLTVSPTIASVLLGGSQQFTASVLGTSNTGVAWSVACSGASGDACGTITATGLYTAPATLPSPTTDMVTVTATSNASSGSKANATVALDSGIRVRLSPATEVVGTDELFLLTPTVTGTNNPAAMTLTWTVAGEANGSTSVGQICMPTPVPPPCQAPAGPIAGPVYFLAPSTAPNPENETIVATSATDTSQFASTLMSVLAAADPAIASITPATAAQGSVFQDVYLEATAGSFFFSTSTVLVNGVAVPTTFLSDLLLRARIPATSLAAAGTVQLAVERQNGDTSNLENFQVVPRRPAVVAAAPRSIPQCSSSCGSASVRVDGGYFTPSTTATFNGAAAAASFDPSQLNQLNVAVPAAQLGTAGLFELAVQNGGAVPSAATNVAVQPSPTANPPSLVTTVPVGNTPSAVAVNIATGEAVVANSGDNSITELDLTHCTSGSCPTATVTVGADPTGVAIDDLRNLALVVNQGDNTLSVVDLSGVNPTQIVPLPVLPAGAAPVSVGVNPLTGHVFVANARTNTATILDDSQSPPVVLGTAKVNTGGGNPQVGIEASLDWAIVTPAGSGSVTAVDMSHTSIDPSTNAPTFNVVFTFTFSTAAEGVAINPETKQALFTNPACAGVGCSPAVTFSLLDQTVTPVTNGGSNFVAAAANPLTNVAVAVSNQSNSIDLIDMGGSVVMGSPIAVGNNPVAVAIDPASNLAIVVNQGDGTVSVLSLGVIRPLQITQLGFPAAPGVPDVAFTSTSSLTLTLLGNGFVAGSVVRLDGASVTPDSISTRKIVVTVPPSRLTGPRRFAVDVENPDGTVSNAEPLTVVQPVPLGAGSAPGAVAVDPTRNLAVVADTGAQSASVVDLTTGAVAETIAVGNSPKGVAVLPRLGEAIVSNFGDNTVSVLDLVNDAVIATTTVGQGPLGVGINQDTAAAIVANNGSNTVTLLAADTGQSQGSVSVNKGPVAVGVDPVLNLAAVVDATESAVDLVNFSSFSLTKTLGLPPNAVFQLPSDIAFDPATGTGVAVTAPGGAQATIPGGVFLVANSLINNLVLADPDTFQLTPVRTGINPTSLAYNFQSATVVTVNTASHTVSVLDAIGRHAEAILPLGGSSQQSVAINPMTNLAVVADQANDRVLLVPLP
jgi:YVTN family beta-propeller protein